MKYRYNQTMYRLTISGKPVEAFLSRTQQIKPTTQRIYRWGNSWGYLRQNRSWDEAWIAEQRSFITSATTDNITFLLEAAKPTTVQPPLNIDDMWDEEVIQDKNITCNSLLSITGSKQELIQICKKHSITLPYTILESC